MCVLTGAGLPMFFKELLQDSGSRFRVPKSWTSGLYRSSNWDPRSTCEVESVLGACLMVGRSWFRQIDGFDEAFFLYDKELDLCGRVRNAGHHVWHVHNAPVILHRTSAGESKCR